MDAVDPTLLARMPLAEAVLVVWRHVADEGRLRDVLERHRGRCHERLISFPAPVQPIADALLRHAGSGRQSFARGRESGRLAASTRAAYGKRSSCSGTCAGS